MEQFPPFSYLLSDQEICESRQTVFGSVPLGALLGYQLTDKNPNKSKFMHSRCNVALSPSKQTKDKLNFPDIPLLAACQQTFYSPSNISAEEDAILNKIIININEAWDTQTNTTLLKLKMQCGFKSESIGSLLQTLDES